MIVFFWRNEVNSDKFEGPDCFLRIYWCVFFVDNHSTIVISHVNEGFKAEFGRLILTFLQLKVANVFFGHIDEANVRFCVNFVINLVF